MPRARAQRLFGASLVQHLADTDVAQRSHAEPAGGFFAFAAALVERAARQRARHTGIEHQQRGLRRQRHAGAAAVVRVSRNSACSVVGQAGGHLVHDSAAHAGVLDFGALGDLREPDVVDRQIQQRRAMRAASRPPAPRSTTGRRPSARSTTDGYRAAAPRSRRRDLGDAAEDIGRESRSEAVQPN